MDLGWDEEEEAREESQRRRFAKRAAGGPKSLPRLQRKPSAEAADRRIARACRRGRCDDAWNPITSSPMTPSLMRIPPNRMSWNLTKRLTKQRQPDEPADGENDDDSHSERQDS